MEQDSGSILDRSDERFWREMEHGYKTVEKMPILPPPEDRNPKGRHVICIYPSDHPYFLSYKDGVMKLAAIYDVRVTFYTSGWDMGKFSYCLRTAVAQKPDLIIYIPVRCDGNLPLLKEAYEKGVPVVASNLLMETEAFRYVVAWTGPDDWGQTRRLAHRVASDLGGRGRYCILTHMPGNSSHYARAWGMITELRKIAPGIELLDIQTTFLDKELTKIQMNSWVDAYGDSLDCIICAGDHPTQSAVSEVLSERGLKDHVRSYFTGFAYESFSLVKDGQITGFIYQNAEADGVLAMQSAIDWFFGMDVPPVRYIPESIITRDNIGKFIKNLNAVDNINRNSLFQALVTLDNDRVEAFFDSLDGAMDSALFINNEISTSISLQILLSVMEAIGHFNLDLNAYIPDLNEIHNKSPYDKRLAESFLWLRNLSLQLVSDVRNRETAKTLSQKATEYIDENFVRDININVIASKLGYSAAYLGQEFRKEKGILLSDYINTVRIAHAKTLLNETLMKGKEIAGKVGYANVNYFYRVFTKYEGVTPAQYRKSRSERRGAV